MSRPKKNIPPAQLEMLFMRCALQRKSDGTVKYSAVGREFGQHPEQVRRLWSNLPEAEQAKYIAKASEVRASAKRIVEAGGDGTEAEAVLDTVARQQVAQTVDFAKTLLECRDIALKLLRERLMGAGAEEMKDKDIIASVRLLSDKYDELVSESDDKEEDPDAGMLGLIEADIKNL